MSMMNRSGSKAALRWPPVVGCRTSLLPRPATVRKDLQMKSTTKCAGHDGDEHRRLLEHSLSCDAQGGTAALQFSIKKRPRPTAAVMPTTVSVIRGSW
jgi:hypothetical protein